jgi:hypothetical protein
MITSESPTLAALLRLHAFVWSRDSSGVVERLTAPRLFSAHEPTDAPKVAPRASSSDDAAPPEVTP